MQKPLTVATKEEVANSKIIVISFGETYNGPGLVPLEISILDGRSSIDFDALPKKYTIFRAWRVVVDKRSYSGEQHFTLCVHKGIARTFRKVASHFDVVSHRLFKDASSNCQVND